MLNWLSFMPSIAFLVLLSQSFFASFSSSNITRKTFLLSWKLHSLSFFTFFKDAKDQRVSFKRRNEKLLLEVCMHQQVRKEEMEKFYTIIRNMSSFKITKKEREWDREKRYMKVELLLLLKSLYVRDFSSHILRFWDLSVEEVL
jgi:hypothetical protein